MARKFVRTQTVDARAIQEAANDRSLAVGAESPREVDAEQAAFTGEVSPDLMRTQPSEQFDLADPDAYPAWQGASGFVENLDDPIRAIKEESLPANLIKWLTGKTDEAVQIERNQYRLDPNVAAINTELGALENAGKIDTPEYDALLEELEAIEEDLNASRSDPEFSFAAVKQAYDKDPGAFAAEFANVIAKDPELLVTPIGWRLAATRAGAALTTLGASTKVAKAGEVAAGAAGTAAAGAAVMGSLSAGEQLGDTGAVTDPDAVALDATLGAGASVLLVGAFKGFAAAAKATTKSGDASSKATAKHITEPLEPLVGSTRTLHLRGNAALENEIRILEEIVAKDAAAAEHGARVEVFDQIDLGLAVAKEIEEHIGFAQIDTATKLRLTAARKADESPMARAFNDALNSNRQRGKATADALSSTSYIGLGGKGSQAGHVDPKVLAATAFIGLGAAAGAATGDNPLAGAVAGVGVTIGAILAGRTLKVLGQGTLNAYKFVKAPDNRLRIDTLTNQWEGDIAVKYRSSWQVKQAIMQDVPDIKRREAITHWLEGDTSIKLTAKEHTVANQVRGIFDKLGQEGRDANVLESFLDDYVPHFWRQGGKPKSEIIQTLSDSAQGAGMGTKTSHAKQRVIPTLREGLDAGLEAQTLDIAEIVKMYDDSLYRTIRNNQLAQVLREQISPDGTPLIIAAGGRPSTAKESAAAARRIAIARDRLTRIEARVANGLSGNVDRAREAVRRAEQAATPAPGDYVPINHRQFAGELVHPDIAPSLNFIYQSSDPNVIFRGVSALNFAMKRSLVSMSMFHANALLESMVYAGVSPTKIVPALNQLAHGSAGDVVDVALRAGLKIGVIEDMGSDVFYAALGDLQRVMDDILPVVGGAPVRGVERLNKVVDKVMWDKIATGGKLATFANEMEKALLNSAAQHAKDPVKNPLVPKEQLAAEVAEYVNDAFGGLNWRRIAEGTKTRLGRDLAMAAFNPASRKWMQLAVFAPDWTIANIRVLLKAIPGQARNKRVARLHQYYAARGAAFFATAGSAINMLYTGRPIWTNADPTTVDMGDGRRMTFSKQFVEPWHWLTEPGQTAINKMGILPKTALELSKGVKFFSGRSSDPPLYADDADFWEKRFAEAGLIGKKFTPIFAQQVADQGVSGIAGFLGHPIYGKRQE